MSKELQLSDVTKSLDVALNKVWPLVEKARDELGFHQTTTEMDLGNLQYSGETPITWISQCAAQAERKASALHEAYWRLQKQKLKVKKLREKNTDESNLKADELESQMHNGEHYIKNAYQDLMHYQQVATTIRQEFDIKEELLPEDLAENSKREHIRKSMRQALRDMENHGTISKGVSEHLEHWGIHPMTARMQIEKYRAEVKHLFEQGQAPTMQHLHQWLEEMEHIHLPAADEMLKYMRLKKE